jgi:hypothetical protein
VFLSLTRWLSARHMQRFLTQAGVCGQLPIDIEGLVLARDGCQRHRLALARRLMHQECIPSRYVKVKRYVKQDQPQVVPDILCYLEARCHILYHGLVLPYEWDQ